MKTPLRPSLLTNKSSIRSLLLLLFALFCGLTGANAQTFRGALSGNVTDASGAIVANAKVTLTNTGTAIELNTVTTSNGDFSFQDLPAGTYSVSVSAAGFQPVNVNRVEVTAGNVYTLPVKLTVGQVSSAIEVSAAAVSVDAESSTQSDTLNDKSVQDLPLNGRDFTQLIAVTPGYGGYAVGGFGSLNGTRANQMNWQIDGTDNNDFSWSCPSMLSTNSPRKPNLTRKRAVARAAP
jgi:hypothetical protein